MNKTVKWALIGTGIVVLAAALVFGGIGVGRTLAYRQVSASYGAMGPGMMTWFSGQADEGTAWLHGQGMMSGQRGMMDGAYGNRPDDAYPYGMTPGSMMGGYRSGLAGVDPLSVEEARSAIEEYLATLGNDDLELHEVMIFDNHAYGMIVEKSSGIGAMEVLVDPVTHAVYPEHGPNMMWNLAYSPMGSGGYGMMGQGFGPQGMMGQGFGPQGMMGGGMMGQGMMGPGYGPQGSIDPSAEMTVSEEEAIEAAQQYLETYLPGATVEDHADAFYGYYTLHILQDGEIVGMLSVNGFSGEVFLHTWHGDFIEMDE